MGDAVILAGGKAPRKLAPKARYEACLTIGGEPMILHVVRALIDAPSTNRIFILGPTDILTQIPFPERVTIAEGAESMADLLRIALRLPQADEPFLLSAADIPLLKPSAVEYLWQSGAREHADLAYPIVRKKQIRSAYPHAHRTYVHLADGTFTGGNILYVGGGVSEDLLAFAERIFEARKHPWQIASLFGLKFCLAFLLRRLTVSDIEQHLSALWTRRCHALIMPSPEIAMDVDKPSDWQLINEYMTQTTS